MKKSKILTVLLVAIVVLMMPLTVISESNPPNAISDDDEDEDEYLYSIYLPVEKGVSYFYDESAYDKEWSDEEDIVLSYAENANVSFTVNSKMPFRIDNIDDDTLFVGKREGGLVSFKMPASDLELYFYKDTQTETEAPTEKPTEAPTEKPTEKPTENPTEKPTEKPTEAPTEKPSEKETDQGQEKRFLVFLPTVEGISYDYDASAYSKQFSGEYYTVLSYKSGDEVDIDVKGTQSFEIVNEESERVFMEMRDSGPVSFQMPDYDVEIRFKAAGQQPGETNPESSSSSTGSTGSSAGTPAVTYGDDWCICLPVKKGVTYTYDNKRFDPEFSDEDEIYLNYDAGEPVSIGVNTSEKFEIVEYDSVDEKVVVPMRGSGTVSFPMPETDLEMIFEGDILQKDSEDKTKEKETQKTKTQKTKTGSSTSENGQVAQTASGTGTDAVPDQTEESNMLSAQGQEAETPGMEYETTAFMETEMLVSANNGEGTNGQLVIRKDETADPEGAETSNPAVVIKIGLDVPVLVFQFIIIIIQLLFIIMCYKR